MPSRVPRVRFGRRAPRLSSVTAVRRGRAVGVNRRNLRYKTAATKGGLGTRTRTRTMVRPKHQKGLALPNRSGSESSYKLMLPEKGILKKVADKIRPMTLTYNGGFVQSQNFGQQMVSQLGAIYDRGDCHNMVNSATVQEFGSSIPPGYKNLQIFLKEGYAEYHIANVTNGVLRITLYDVLPRRDCYQDIGGAPLDAAGAWQSGMIQQQFNGSTSTYNDVGCRPYDSAQFNDFFKVKCVTHVDLAPGQIHWHRVKWCPKKFLSRDIIDADNSSITCYKGLTLYTLAVTVGQPIHDAASGVTTTNPKIEWVQNISYHYSYVANNVTNTYVQATLSTSAQLNFESLVTGASAAFSAV